MTNAEAIEILKRLQDPEPWEPQINSAAYNALNMAISALEKQEGTMPKWISANKKKPHAEYGEGDTVLTVNELGVMHLLYWDGGNWCEPTGECYDSHFKVTHWMPLPKPPEEGGGEDG